MNMKKIISTVKLLGLYLLTGVSCGVIGTLFSKGILLVTNMRHDNSWLLYFLPVAGVLTVAIYKLLDVNGVGTNQVIKSADGKTVLSPKLAPAVFCASLLSHLCGASVGREGAALQLGGSFAALLSKCFKLTEENGKNIGLLRDGRRFFISFRNTLFSRRFCIGSGYCRAHILSGCYTCDYHFAFFLLYS